RFANLTRRVGTTEVAYIFFTGMKGADDSFLDSMTALDKALDANGSPNLDDALASTDAGLRHATETPLLDGQPGGFRHQILELLNRHKELIERLKERGASYKPTANKEFAEIIEAHNRFRAEFDPWLREYMKDNGYELKPGADRDE